MSKTVRQLLQAARARLQEAGVESATLDARLLLQAAAGLSHADIVAEPDAPVSLASQQIFENGIQRRLAAEPVSRILGIREFYGRSFGISPAVLDPRPDTETLIEAVLAQASTAAPLTLLDLGTGSGAIALTLLAELPHAEAVLVDISPDALDVARRNATTLKVVDRARFCLSDWLAKVSGQYDVIVSNPPYIAQSEASCLARDVVDYDPHLALFAGDDGLLAYRAIAADGERCLRPGGKVFVEIGAGQALAVQDIFAARGWQCQGQYHDLAGHVRCLQFMQAKSQPQPHAPVE